MTTQFAASDVACGDSFDKPNSGVYSNAPDARSLASPDGPINPLQSQLAAPSPWQSGVCNSQVAFSGGQTQRAFRTTLLLERNSLRNTWPALLSSSMACGSPSGRAWDLIAEQHGLRLWLGVDVQYRRNFQERIAVGQLSTHTAVLPKDFQSDQLLDWLAETVQFRNANFLRNARHFVLDNVYSALLHVARYAQTHIWSFR